jgi:hypothetical protein
MLRGISAPRFGSSDGKRADDPFGWAFLRQQTIGR